MEHLGRHVILEYYGCSEELLNEPEALREIFTAAVRRMRAHIVSSHFHRFNPHGVSGVVVISESHLSVHTWPEFGYAAVDVFTCGDVVDPWDAHREFVRALEPERSSHVELKRGSFDVPKGTLPTSYDVEPLSPEDA